MEQKNSLPSLTLGLMGPLFWIGLCSALYLAFLPMANTIALRNLALLGALVCLIWQFPKIRPAFRNSLPLLLWTVYLLVFPLIAEDHLIAWKSLGGQWGRGLVAMAVGIGVAVLLSNRVKGMVFYLGAFSAAPCLVHLFLFACKAWETGAIPWGYWGRETHHADLGYAAGQTVVLMTAAIIAADRKFRLPAIMLIIAALLSTALARSRAGFVFAVLGLLLVLVPAFFTQASRHQRLVLLSLATVTALVVACLAVFAVKVDPRWSSMQTQLSTGFLGKGLQIECEGTASVESVLIAQFGDTEQTAALINSIRDGDGARMVLVRAGAELALKHPWGSDGSRQAFQKLLRQECPQPAISMAHTHNGWIDTWLAIGCPGAVLYLFVLFFFCWQGLRILHRQHGHSEWDFVLVALSIFWILRGLTDSVFRDHMLEMQGFVLAFALVASRLYQSDWPSEGEANFYMRPNPRLRWRAVRDNQLPPSLGQSISRSQAD
jgi:hypothetical protein